jgi:hypothetical protein
VLLAQPELLTPPFPALPSPDAPLPLARRPLLFPPLRRARVLRLGAWAGQTTRRSWPLSARNKQSFKTCRHPANRQNKGRRKSTHQRANWSMVNA